MSYDVIISGNVKFCLSGTIMEEGGNLVLDNQQLQSWRKQCHDAPSLGLDEIVASCEAQSILKQNLDKNVCFFGPRAASAWLKAGDIAGQWVRKDLQDLMGAVVVNRMDMRGSCIILHMGRRLCGPHSRMLTRRGRDSHLTKGGGQGMPFRSASFSAR